ncbi:MAG: isoamylase early set domain-containing protein [Deltaproteobacteria bacterium]|nr:isoamylase early set domain-containing protein [Deltaproteobacteria bacterium]
MEAKKTAKGKESRTVAAQGIKKEYPKGKNVCRVTFRLPKVAASGAKHVYIVGEFNNWNMYANPMRKLKNGNFTVTLDLPMGKEYQFRYLIDDVKWENDWNADKYVKSPYGDSDNSVVIV